MNDTKQKPTTVDRSTNENDFQIGSSHAKQIYDE